MATALKKCSCVSNQAGNKDGAKYQDEKYGKGVRLHNGCISTSGGSKWRCTVCGDMKTGGAPSEFVRD